MKEEAEDAGGEQGGGVVALSPALQYSPRPPTSEFINRYNDLLGDEERLPTEKMREQLQLAGIQHDPSLEADHFEMRILRQSRGGEAVNMWVQLGGFSMEVSLFQCDQPSPLHGGHCLYGSCGNVYLLEVGDAPELAAKCIEFRLADSSPEERLRVVLRTIKEYCLAKVACALQIGPKLVPFQNWDLIIRKRCIEFWMERCCLEEEVVLREQTRNTLRTSLRMLHSLHIAHCDVKTNNILFSPSFHKLVFIDFGVSRLLSETPGYTTPTRFVGTLETSSPAMAALLANSQVGYVDLYYNDAFAFSKSLLGDPTRETKTPLQDIIRYFHPEQRQFDLPRIQYFLFHDQTTQATKLLKKMKGDSILAVLSFFAQLPPTSKLREFYQQHIAGQWGDSMRFRDLWHNYRFGCSNHVEVSLRHREEDYWRCNTRNRQFYSLLTEQPFSLWALDNQDRLAKPASKQLNVYDAFLTKVTLTKRKRRKATAAFLEKEIDEFIKTEKVQIVQGDYADKLRGCLDHLIDLCLSKLSEGWTVRLLEQVLQQRVFLGPFLNFQRIKYYSRLFSWSGQQSVRSKCMLAIMRCNILALSLYDHDPKFILTSAQNNELEEHYSKWSLTKTSDRGGKYDYLLIRAMEKDIQLVQLSALEKECLAVAWTEERKRFLELLRVKALKREKRLQKTRLFLSNLLRTYHNGQHLQPQHLLLAKVYCELKDYSKAKQLLSFADAIMVHPQVSRRCLFEDRLLMELINPSCEFTYHRHLSILRPAKLSYLLLYAFFIIHNNYERYPQLCLKFYRKFALCFANDHNLDMILQTGKVKQAQKMIHNKLYSQLQEKSQKTDVVKLQECMLVQQVWHLWKEGHYDQLQQIVERELSLNRCFNMKQTIILDYYLKILLKRQNKRLKNVLLHLHDDLLRDPDQMQWWIGQLSVYLLFRYQAHGDEWQPFREILCILVQLVEVHPTTANIRAYMRCLRYAFCQPLNLVMLSTALQSLNFIGQQWRQPYFSLFQLEAIAQLANILNTAQLRSLLWKCSRSWPFLPTSAVNFCLQQHISLLLTAPLRPRFKLYLLKTARKLINFSPRFAHRLYSICQVQVKNEGKAIQNFIQEGTCPTLELLRKEPIVRGHWTNSPQGLLLEKKLKKYHKNAQNLSHRSVPSKQRLRIEFD